MDIGLGFRTFCEAVDRDIRSIIVPSLTRASRGTVHDAVDSRISDGFDSEVFVAILRDQIEILIRFHIILSWFISVLVPYDQFT